MEVRTITVPSARPETRRPPLPLLAALVPMASGVVLWLVTGSPLTLGFAALGPVVLLASLLDGARGRRRERRRGQAEAATEWSRAEAELRREHADEHARAWRASPDAAACLLERPLHGHEALDGRAPLVVGRGRGASRVRAQGADDERARAFRAKAEVLVDAPVVVSLGGGVCVRGPAPVAVAVVRALVTQLCLRFPPGRLRVTGDALASWALDGFPHARRAGGFVVTVGDASGDDADAMICVRAPGEDPPAGVTSVIDVVIPARARLRTADGIREVSVEALSGQQAATVAADCSARDDDGESMPDRVELIDLTPAEPRGLSATFAHGQRGPLTVDLVEDGPHAIVTGMTGTGKSELLTSWVAAIASAHPPDRVAFVLIDFKGGTAFDPLRALPHVVAVVTDLDAGGARRGVGSLRAELRRREAVLAAAGARDVSECAELSRLVVVVDEFAALLQEHPDLGAVFTDVAARGRALGMHLVLGTQRASGVVRDALAANCPLRLSLRVADSADSRFVIGTDAAAALPGGPESRGLAQVRRPRDVSPQTVRIALTSPTALDSVLGRWPGSERQESPWLPELPALIELPPSRGAEVVLGMADEPELQRQPWAELRNEGGLAIVGGPRTGKTSAIRLIAAQRADAVRVPSDLEDAWDAVAELAAGRHGLVLCDDVDVLLASYPPEYAQLFLSRWEIIARADPGAVITMSRASGPAVRLADALPQRAVLGLPSTVEHIAAGGDPSRFVRDRRAGRALLDGRETQLCWVGPGDEQPRETHGIAAPRWTPTRELCGVVVGAVEAVRAALVRAHPEHAVVSLDAATLRDPQEPLIVVADPEQWRGNWALLQAVRSHGELLVAAECPGELRQFTGTRELPPFARLHENRGWSTVQGGRPRRVLIG